MKKTAILIFIFIVMLTAACAHAPAPEVTPNLTPSPTPDTTPDNSVDLGNQTNDDGNINGDDSFDEIVSSLTQDIRDLIPSDMLEKIIDLGMPIYAGITPPDMTGTFLSSPHVLLASNYDDMRSPGHKFADSFVTFYEQDNQRLTIGVKTASEGPEGGVVGEGVGGFIVGSEMNFTVFVVQDVIRLETDDAFTRANLYSGTLTDDGILNLHTITLILDEGPDPSEMQMRNGQARLIHDSDGFSEKIG
ncbi:MAG: hypothetical protein FWD44_02575 [Oscillospiraceae bacterium]|nr:hypothetical protein [Oscillospiraceae bacterium]